MINKESKNERRQKRKLRGRKKIHGSAERPRLSVFRSNKHVSVQLIDDMAQQTLASASSLEPEIRKDVEKLPQMEVAQRIGTVIAERAQKKGITKVVFDRGGYPFHGKVKRIADTAREKGLVF